MLNRVVLYATIMPYERLKAALRSTMTEDHLLDLAVDYGKFKLISHVTQRIKPNIVAVSNRWTGLLEWTTGMDYWNGL